MGYFYVKELLDNKSREYLKNGQIVYSQTTQYDLNSNVIREDIIKLNKNIIKEFEYDNLKITS